MHDTGCTCVHVCVRVQTHLGACDASGGARDRTGVCPSTTERTGRFCVGAFCGRVCTGPARLTASRRRYCRCERSFRTVYTRVLCLASWSLREFPRNTVHTHSRTKPGRVLASATTGAGARTCSYAHTRPLFSDETTESSMHTLRKGSTEWCQKCNNGVSLVIIRQSVCLSSAPGMLLNFPGEHAMQPKIDEFVCEPGTLPYFPAVHNSQLVLPAVPAQVPAPQGSHVASENAPATLLNFPCSSAPRS